MLTHRQIWQALDALALRHGMSPSGLARAAGLDATTFNKSKRTGSGGKERWPSTESVAKALAATGETMESFAAFLDGQVGAQPGTASASVPLIGLAQAGRGGYFDDGGFPAGSGWDEVALPGGTGAQDENMYALEISGDSMAPVYRNGDIIVVSPNAPVKVGDRVVVKTRDGEVMAKELAQKNATSLTLASLNPEFPVRDVALRDVAWVARILWVKQ